MYCNTTYLYHCWSNDLAEAPNHPEDKDRNKQPPSTPSSLPPPPSRGGPTPAGGTLGTSGPSALPPVHSFHISQRTKSTLPLKPAEAVPPTDVPAQGKEAEGTSVRERWRQMVLAEQGSPGWTPVARPCWSSVGKSTPGVTPPAVQSPSTPVSMSCGCCGECGECSLLCRRTPEG